MTTLTSEPLAPLLARLFAEDTASEAPGQHPELFALSLEERRRLSRSSKAEDYQRFYSLAKDIHLAVSEETGHLLYLLVRAVRPRTIVEFGTSFGISTLCLAAALRDNGLGRLITSEFEPHKAAAAQANFAAAGLDDLIELREGDALQTLARDLPERIDLVLMDGAKGIYPAVFALLEPRLAPGALVIADDADASPAYLERVRGDGYVSVPFASDLELSLRV